MPISEFESHSGEVYSIQHYVIDCQWLAAGRWFSPVSSTNKTGILLKVALNTITLTLDIMFSWLVYLYMHSGRDGIHGWILLQEMTCPNMERLCKISFALYNEICENICIIYIINIRITSFHLRILFVRRYICQAGVLETVQKQTNKKKNKKKTTN